MYFKCKDSLKVKSWRKRYHAYSEHKKFGVALLLLYKIGLMKRSRTEVKFIMIKESIKQKDVKIMNMCAFKIGASK